MPEQIEIDFQRADFSDTKMESPQFGYEFNVSNHSGATVQLATKKAGWLRLWVPIMETWDIFWVDGNDTLKPGDKAVFQLRQRLGDMRDTIFNYQGRDDFRLDFSDVRVSILTEKVGPLQKEQWLHFPDVGCVAVPNPINKTVWSLETGKQMKD